MGYAKKLFGEHVLPYFAESEWKFYFLNVINIVSLINRKIKVFYIYLIRNEQSVESVHDAGQAYRVFPQRCREWVD
jgi:hypothetical protein